LAVCLSIVLPGNLYIVMASVLAATIGVLIKRQSKAPEGSP